MKIVSLSIENWRSYHGNQTIQVSNGLNLFLGENGEGKTKLFEAFKWFLNGSENDCELDYVSAKALKDLPVDKKLVCSLSLSMEDEDDYGSVTDIKKSFTVVKRKEGNFSRTNATYSGVYSNRKGERFPIEDSKKVLSSLFPDQTRAFSVFEGEDKLDILGQKNSLKALISLLTDRGIVSNNLEGVDYLCRKTLKAYEDSFKHEKKLHTELRELNKEIGEAEDDLETLDDTLSGHIVNSNKLNDEIDKLSSILSRAKEFNTIVGELREKKAARARAMSSVKDNFTRSLFDDQWLLVGFDSTMSSLDKLYTQAEKNRRIIQRDYDLQIGQKRERRSLQNDLKNGVIPFPIGVPGKDRLKEMLDDEICKVCGREAPKGSTSYDYIKSHHSILDKPVGPEQEDLGEEIFKNNFVKELNDILVMARQEFKSDEFIKDDIKGVVELNQSLIEKAATFDEEIGELKNAIDSITGVSGVSETRLESVISDFTTLSEAKEHAGNNIAICEERKRVLSSKIASLKVQRDSTIGKGGVKNPNLKKALDYSTFLKDAFGQLWESQLNSLTKELEEKTNEVFAKINVDAFRGRLKLKCDIYSKGDFDITVIHELSDGKRFRGANKSLITSANIALVLAASTLVQDLGYSSYPLILDAPISSFGEKKSISFLKALKDSSGQFLLLLKDFIQQDGNDLKLSDGFKNVEASKVYWLKLKRPFNDEDLTTLQTQIIPVR